MWIICGFHGNQESSNFIFPLIFQRLKCSYSLVVADGLFRVVLNKGEIIRNILTPKLTKLHALVQNENKKNMKKVHKFVQKSSKWQPFWNFGGYICILPVFGGIFFYLKMLLQVITLF